MKQEERDWSKHPIIVAIAAIAGLVAIIAFITGKQGLPSLLPHNTPTPTAEVFDIRDDFADEVMDVSKWERVEGEVSPVIQDGILSLNVATPDDYTGGSIYANLGNPIRAIAARTEISEGTYPSSAGLTALVISEDEQQWYVKFGLVSNGDIFLKRGTVVQGQEEPLGEWRGGGVSIPHILRIEWTGEEVEFFADDELLKSLPSSEPGWWVALYADANSGGSIKSTFDWVGWNFR